MTSYRAIKLNESTVHSSKKDQIDSPLDLPSRLYGTSSRYENRRPKVAAVRLNGVRIESMPDYDYVRGKLSAAVGDGIP